jgi:manganese efflux pump family protein
VVAGEIILLALALGLDSFRVSLGLGAAGLAGGGERRLALSFAVCDAVALAAGVALAHSLASLAGTWVDGLGPSALAAYALYVLWLARSPGTEKATAGWVVLGLPLMLSLDNFFVGGTLGGLRISLLGVALLVGIASGLLALAGLIVGRRASRSLRLRPELAGAALLLLASGLSLHAGG